MTTNAYGFEVDRTFGGRRQAGVPQVTAEPLQDRVPPPTPLTSNPTQRKEAQKQETREFDERTYLLSVRTYLEHQLKQVNALLEQR